MVSVWRGGLYWIDELCESLLVRLPQLLVVSVRVVVRVCKAPIASLYMYITFTTHTFFIIVSPFVIPMILQDMIDRYPFVTGYTV